MSDRCHAMTIPAGATSVQCRGRKCTAGAPPNLTTTRTARDRRTPGTTIRTTPAHMATAGPMATPDHTGTTGRTGMALTRKATLTEVTTSGTDRQSEKTRTTEHGLATSQPMFYANSFTRLTPHAPSHLPDHSPCGIRVSGRSRASPG